MYILYIINIINNINTIKIRFNAIIIKQTIMKNLRLTFEAVQII